LENCTPRTSSRILADAIRRSEHLRRRRRSLDPLDTSLKFINPQWLHIEKMIGIWFAAL
jgi:hypothetical protein